MVADGAKRELVRELIVAALAKEAARQSASSKLDDALFGSDPAGLPLSGR
jgi:hypothetical protein